MKPPDVSVSLQSACTSSQAPSELSLSLWVRKAIEQLKFVEQPDAVEVCIRIVDIEEMSTLNQTYRNKPGPTNVLSFTHDFPVQDPELLYLGDIVLCAPVVEKEALQQEKALLSHWAHLVVHGTLHLLGYDHQEDDEAATMESQEILIMKELGFENPYGAPPT